MVLALTPALHPERLYGLGRHEHGQKPEMAPAYAWIHAAQSTTQQDHQEGSGANQVTTQGHAQATEGSEAQAQQAQAGVQG